jgi:hypothetical protein
MNRTTTVFGLMAHLNSLLLTFVDFIVGKRGNPLSCSEGNGSIGLDSDGGEIALGGIRMGSSCVVSWECGSSVPPRRIGSSCAMVYPPVVIASEEHIEQNILGGKSIKTIKI